MEYCAGVVGPGRPAPHQGYRRGALAAALERSTASRQWIMGGVAPAAVGAAGGVYSTPGAIPPAGQRPRLDCRRRAARRRQSGRLRPLSRWGVAPCPTDSGRTALRLTTALRSAEDVLLPSHP